MENRILVLITNTFPFGKGETFIDNEIPFYNKFDKVYIAPIDYDDFLRYKELDSNIEVVRIPRWNYLSKFLWLLYSLILPEFYEELFLLIKKKQFFVSRLYALLVFLAIGNRTILHIRRNLKNLNENLTFYSYWLHHGAYASIKLRNILGGKSVSRCHGYDLYEHRHSIQYLPMRKFLLNQLDGIYTISEDGLNYLQKYNISTNICISRLGTKDYGINECTIKDELCIVSCSWLSPVKRVHRILDTLSSIDSIKIKWIHIGGGDSLEYLKEKAKVLPENITAHFPGSMNPTEIFELYKKTPIHLFLNVSESEGVPVSIMEAMSFGIPVIATNVGGTSEIVVDGVNGFLLKKNFLNSELHQLLMIIKNFPEYKYCSLRNEARKTWKDKYNSTINYGGFINSLFFL